MNTFTRRFGAGVGDVHQGHRPGGTSSNPCVPGDPPGAECRARYRRHLAGDHRPGVDTAGGVALREFSSDAFLDDPYPTYARLRETEPVAWWELPHHPRGGMWMLSRYDDVRAMLVDARTTKVAARVGIDDVGPPPILMFLDPPEHTRVRKPTVAAFTRHRIAALRPGIERAVDTLLEPLRDGATYDVVASLARPLPLDTISELLGVPESDRPHLQEVTDRLLDATDAAADAPPGAEEAAEQELVAHVAALVQRLAASPGDDLLSALLTAPDGALDVHDVTMMGVQLLVNGHSTTVNLIGTALFHLLRHREQWARLVADPGLVPDAVQECLRHDSPNQRTSGRFTLEPLTYAGVTIEAGQGIGGWLGAANRDPDRFDRPDELDVTRQPNPHLAFGQGLHRCPGAALTQLEVAVVLERLVTTVPDLALVEERPTYLRNSFDRGLTRLLVTA